MSETGPFETVGPLARRGPARRSELVARISVSERVRATVSDAERWTEPDKLGERRASTAPERPAGPTCVQDPAPILLTGLQALSTRLTMPVAAAAVQIAFHFGAALALGATASASSLTGPAAPQPRLGATPERRRASQSRNQSRGSWCNGRVWQIWLSHARTQNARLVASCPESPSCGDQQHNEHDRCDARSQNSRSARHRRDCPATNSRRHSNHVSGTR